MATGPTREVFEQRRRGAGLGDQAALLAALARPGLRLRAVPGTDVVGASRIGGRPDLPETTGWPGWQGRSLSFLAQVDLGSLPDEGDRAELPPPGLLSFFYDVESRAVERLALDAAQAEAYAELVDGDLEPRHVLLGHPDPVQG